MAVTTTKRRKTSKANKFEIILKEAARLFCEKGYEATSLDDVADAVSIHKATLYHYIQSKEEILYLCLLRSFEGYEQRLEEMKDTSVSVTDRLRRFFRTLIEAQNNEFGRCLCLVGRQPLGTESGEKILEFQRNMGFAVRRLLQEGIDDGSFKACDTRLAANMIFGAFNSVPKWRRPDAGTSTRQIAETYLDLFISGITARPEAAKGGPPEEIQGEIQGKARPAPRSGRRQAGPRTRG
ncbi:TetR/AcrR family transcriptional regulator [Xanthobacter agilis]|uniref:AcrR family transcriptional regulator n=1 Tax=Xanthobacter agilis TaxID=47492 RepID=A0ABU0L916_XANAG|nr:TetR/AcrR family transcriptional regulator [Xanthobacter agilis]MDQ0503605.1 AcrR family transcriptional regulator [Xanthobacter agilis]